MIQSVSHLTFVVRDIEKTVCDYDNHLFERHTGTLPERHAAYRQGTEQTI